MSKEEAVNREINSFRERRDDAKRAQERVELRLIESPGDAKAQNEAESLEREIAEYDRKIKRLESARKAAAVADTDAAKKAELGRLKTTYAEIEQRLVRQGELAAEIVAAIDTLGPHLAEYAVLADDNQHATWSLIKAAHGKSADRVFTEHAIRAARGAGAAPAIINALYASGVGRTGIHSHYIDVTRVEQLRPLEDAMAAQRDSLLGILRRAIERRELEVYGKLVEEAPPTAEQRFIKGAPKAGQDADSFVAARNAGKM